MWRFLRKLPSILVGQCIFSYLGLKDLVRLESALASNEQIQTLCSFLSYLSKPYMKVDIPFEMSKLKWLQAHRFPISKAIVGLHRIKSTFELNMIDELELVSNFYFITRKSLNYLPDSCYKKVVSVFFKENQDVFLMEELFSELHNLRELRFLDRPDGWIQTALQGLQRGTNNNILIEKVDIRIFDGIDYSIAEIVKYFPRLKSLSVSFEIVEDSLLALSTYCPLLEELKLFRIPKVFSEQSAALCAPALSCIHSICTPDDVMYHEIPYCAMAVPYLTELREIRAIGRRDYRLMPVISQYCMKLEILDIEDYSTTTPAQLQQLAQNCRHLHTISVSTNMTLTDEIIIRLAEYCPNLQKLYLSSNNDIVITDASLLALSEHCPHIRELSLLKCTQLTETAVLHLIQRYKHLYRLVLPDTCLSEDSVLSLPVTISRQYSTLTLDFHTYCL